ncbi:MAG: FAD-dependent oxidoreductase [Alphaproteobacteria bacterium]|nr:FAD-dependent oxidoreductase [Alphaproteobacteria bacterium]
MSEFQQNFDIVIIGGGVIGGATATFLARREDFNGSIAVIERDRTYEFASTPRSMGGVRQQFTTPENIRISQFTAEFLRNLPDYLAVEGETPDLSFRQNGYLFLASSESETAMRRIHATQTREGAPVALLTPDEIGARFPEMRLDGVTLGSFGTEHEGWIDAFALVQGFRKKAQSLGVAFLNEEAVGLTLDKGRVSEVQLRSGIRIGCGIAVNAAGYMSGSVAAWAGLDMPVKPRKRMVFVIDNRRPAPHWPLLIDLNGVYIRPEGRYFLCGVSPEESEDSDADPADFEVDHDWFETRIWETLAARALMFEAVKVVNAWAGHYDMNLFDHNAILGPHPDVPNLIHATGFSGHGIQQSPAVGRGVAELIATGGYESLDLSAFRVERIAENKPFVEEAVV